MEIIHKRHRLSNLHFYLRDKKSKGKTEINLEYYIGISPKKKFKYSTKEHISPDFWNFRQEKAKLSLTHPENVVINEKLDKLRNFVEQTLKENPRISIEYLKDKLDIFLGLKSSYSNNESYQSLLCFMHGFIDTEKKKSNPTTTWKKYNTVYNQLLAFCVDNNMQDLIFGDIDFNFLFKFVDWLYSPPRMQSQNSARKSIGVIKKFMNLSSKMKYRDKSGVSYPYHTNMIYQEKEFNISVVKTTKHPLLYTELNELYNFNLDNNLRLDRVRDLFLIAAFTGLRYSDFIRLTHQNIIEEKGKYFIKMFIIKGNTRKANNEVIIPCFPITISIFKKYNFNLPTNISNQKMNDYLKELGKLTNLNRLVLNKASIGGKIIETKIPLYETITNHTARYTFITIMINEFDISPVELTKITGQSLNILIEYEKGDTKSNALKVMNKIESKSNSKFLFSE